jgi:superfamily II DNA/RNA helicase
MKFDDLGLDPKTLKAVKEKGYDSPTPIQAKAIPLIQMTRDVVGLAQTGTGKTASFTLPMIDALSGGRAKMRMPRSLVLAPTRELAAQVAENFDDYGKYHKLNKALLVGGESMLEQKKLLEQGVDVLIATPGRLLDLFDRGSILLNDIKILVIDEADRMLDMGFIPDIEKIVSLIPPMRQTLLFSATMPNEIKKLTEKFLSNPKHVSVAAAASPAETVEQFLVECAQKAKNDILHKLLKQEKVKNAFIFLNRKKDIDALSKFLNNKGYKAAGLHGDMVQVKRTETLQRFKDDEVTLLVCSDVAARGLDVKGVSHVFNYDVPFSADDYVHRIGRTGRAGSKGRAWMFATKNDEKFMDAIQKLIKRQFEPVDIKAKSSDGGGNHPNEGSPSHKGKKPSSKNSSHGASKEDVQNSSKNAPKKAQRRSKNQIDDDDDMGDSFGDDVPAFLR